MLALLRRFSCLSLAFVLAACGSEDANNDGGAGSGAEAGSGGSASSSEHAQVRFLYRDDWSVHLGAGCAWISDYRIKFAASPVPVTATIDLQADSLSEYFEVDGRTYEDADVLHVFTCHESQTSDETLQVISKLGSDLPLEAGKHYTVTLGGTTATLAEDP